MVLEWVGGTHPQSASDSAIAILASRSQCKLIAGTTVWEGYYIVDASCHTDSSQIVEHGDCSFYEVPVAVRELGTPSRSGTPPFE